MDAFRERQNQIEELERWTKTSTSYDDLSPYDVIRFFDKDPVNISNEPVQVAQVCQKMVEWAMKQFKIGKYTAREYANVILLRKTAGCDIKKMREQTEMENQSFVRLPMTYKTKLDLTMNALAQIWKEIPDAEIPQTTLIEKLVLSGELSETDAKTFVEKAIQTGAILSSRSGYIKRE